MTACKDGRRDVVQMIIDRLGPSIELNARNNGGDTAFMMACSNGHKGSQCSQNYPEVVAAEKQGKTKADE